MPARVDDFNKKFVYTETNPEGIIAAKKGAFFYRRDNDFYINLDGNLETGNWEKLNYRTVIIPPPPLTKLIKYKRPHEIWLKTTDGFYNDLEQLMPKTGWKIFAYKDAFAIQIQNTVRWVFPPPKTSYDAFGTNGEKSYDENYLYVKFSGLWYRVPLAIYTFIGSRRDTDNPTLVLNPPFSDNRAGYPGITSYDLACSMLGDQTYDNDFFYVRVNSKTWKRTTLNVFQIAYKMTIF